MDAEVAWRDKARYCMYRSRSETATGSAPTDGQAYNAMENSDQETLQIRFCPNAGDMPPTRQWRESNCALKRLLHFHRPVLGKATVLAGEIRNEIKRLSTFMEALRRRTCRFCPTPCCIANTVWIDFRDLLMLHLLDEPLPAQQAITQPGEACPFLGGHGCRLPWVLRPWMCLKYICPNQLAILTKEKRPDPAALNGSIDRIENQRLRMETEVLGRIKRKRRTWPSSSSAWPQ